MHLNHKTFTNANDIIMKEVDKGRNEAAHFNHFKEMAK